MYLVLAAPAAFLPLRSFHEEIPELSDSRTTMDVNEYLYGSERKNFLTFLLSSSSRVVSDIDLTTIYSGKHAIHAHLREVNFNLRRFPTSLRISTS